MGFFDEIDALPAPRKGEAPQKTAHQAASGATPGTAPGDPAATPAQGGTTTGQPAATRQPSPGPGKRPRPRPAPRKPERLAFLQPCPLCEGRQFIHGAGGGFYCVTCQPGQQGQPVEAAGPDRQAPTITPEDLEPAGDVDTTHQADTVNTGPTEEQRAHFRAAWAWITKNREPLLAAGWTPATLFRRARYHWPYGTWGVAWLPVWDRPGLAVTIGPRGAIVFTYPSHGRTITQTAHPPNQGTKEGPTGTTAGHLHNSEGAAKQGKGHNINV